MTPSNPLIRRATSEDTRGIHEAHMRSICEICTVDYLPEQIAAWGGRPFDHERRLRDILNDYVWVIEFEKNIEGFGHFRRLVHDKKEYGVISGLYFTPTVKGRGLGRILVSLMEQTSRTLNLFRIELQSTLTSLNFYQKMGYKEVGDKIQVSIGGVDVPCYPMEKHLNC